MAPGLSVRATSRFRICGKEDVLSSITSRVILSDGPNTLFDKDGSAFLISELAAEYPIDPPTKDASGWRRIACGVGVM
ncbi:MAG: hypothetical protein KGS09_19450 [Nitrospirae bacterium]|nr:hypothetical protein [Nitrospirota bacterium]MDE3042812.1 hypothetical protein [Nitrospirota bacterium]MDE3050455.1 hypothetical protein [Nitrospirota bacterium]MDE3218260.1 hypothetical protein [Nitrospirota bacterium]